VIQLAGKNDLSTQWLSAGLDKVSACFAQELTSDLDCVNELVGHVEQYRGKMLRPTLVLSAAAAAVGFDGRGDGENRGDGQDRGLSQQMASLVTLATVTEMVHMATLVHDDILDDADMRRRGATINYLRGNESAVMLGDYLISHSYHLCTSLGRPEISRQIAQTTNTVCEGELLQLANRNHWELDEATYFEIIRRKTAVLTAACCRLGGVLAGADEAVVQALNDYGMKLGVAFQIIDDVLDLTGDTDSVGKTLGRDLAKGKLTLPLIHFLAAAPDDQRAQAIEWLNAAERSAAELNTSEGGGEKARQAAESLTQMVLAGDGLTYSKGAAERLVEEAKQDIIRHLPDSEMRSLLLVMADRVISRDR